MVHAIANSLLELSTLSERESESVCVSECECESDSVCE